MVSTGNLKSADFYRIIPRDLKEAASSTYQARLSMLLALCVLLLVGMELRNYFTVKAFSSVMVDRSADGEFLRIQLNISFPALPCEYASVDVSDVLGTAQRILKNTRKHVYCVLTTLNGKRFNITNTMRKFPIPDLRTTGSEFHPGSKHTDIKRGGDTDEDFGGGSISLSSDNFGHYSHQYPLLVVKFYAPWCFYSKKIAPAWEKAANIIRERYDPIMDGRILIGEVDCSEENGFCKRNRIQGYPSIRIFRNGSDVRGEDGYGHLEHESYYGDRDPKSLVSMMESVVASVPAPVTKGCRIEGFLHVKRVPGNLIISARSASNSFDSSKMNMSHVVSHLSFSNAINAKLLSDTKRWSPYIGASHGRLDGKAFITPHDLKVNVTIEHYLQVVKKQLVSKRGLKKESLLEEYEYTAQSSISHSMLIPVAKFHMEPSPLQVMIEEKAW